MLAILLGRAFRAAAGRLPWLIFIVVARLVRDFVVAEAGQGADAGKTIRGKLDRIFQVTRDIVQYKESSRIHAFLVELRHMAYHGDSNLLHPQR
jgi:hypothetical protein